VLVDVSRTGKTSIVFAEPGDKVNSQYSWLEGLWIRVYTAAVQGAAITSGRCS